MKERPILFSTPMVQAILEGRKTQTRRVVKTNEWEWVCFNQNSEDDGYEINMNKCRFGKPGDQLWVREEHYKAGFWVIQGLTKTGFQKWKFVSCKNKAQYFDNPPDHFQKSRMRDEPAAITWYKRLARFMPLSDSRITLEITDIRVERLQDISEEDAKAEGVKPFPKDIEGDCWTDGKYTTAFQYLWNEINGWMPNSWNSNPWVWVISFNPLTACGQK